MSEQLHMLTTVDNPYSPITQWDAWYNWDEAAGYHTTSYLARVVRTSDALSQRDQDLAIEYAIDEIVEYNILGVYRKIPYTPDVEPTPLQSVGS